MAELTRADIAALTGLSRSALTRHLQQFADARSGRGRYDSSEPGFGAWLATFGRGEAPHTRIVHGDPPGQSRGAAFFHLPSGIILQWAAWDLLRGDDEQFALAALDRLIDAWRLPPHPAVPDELEFRALRLPSGLTLNRSQWRILRGSSPARALHALDVLIRRYGCTRP